MIGVVDYGVGNCRAFVNAYKRLNIRCRLVEEPGDIHEVDKLILPGVGSFDFAISRLRASGLLEELAIQVTEHQKPILGICVGMQMLADGSDEGELPGLSWVPGYVRKMSSGSSEKRVALPHMGWNTTQVHEGAKLFAGLNSSARFYFLHSYYFDCPESNRILATCDYGESFCCAVQNENVFGVQFHPEKSHAFGTTLLRNFAEI